MSPRATGKMVAFGSPNEARWWAPRVAGAVARHRNGGHAFEPDEGYDPNARRGEEGDYIRGLRLQGCRDASWAAQRPCLRKSGCGGSQPLIPTAVYIVAA